jgi:hypothetical protein
MMARMKELEVENARLKKMYIEEKFKAEIVPKHLQKSGKCHPTGVRWPKRQYLSAIYPSG